MQSAVMHAVMFATYKVKRVCLFHNLSTTTIDIVVPARPVKPSLHGTNSRGKN
jgi:hypothetical protein